MRATSLLLTVMLGSLAVTSQGNSLTNAITWRALLCYVQLNGARGFVTLADAVLHNVSGLWLEHLVLRLPVIGYLNFGSPESCQGIGGEAW